MMKKQLTRLAIAATFCAVLPMTGPAQDTDAVPVPFIKSKADDDVKPGPARVAVSYQVDWKPLDKAVEAAAVDKKPVLVLIGADFCYGCKALQTNLNRVAKDDRLASWHLAKVDYSKEREVATSLMGDASLLPQLILSEWNSNQKKWIHRKLVGVPKEKELKAWIFRPIGKEFSFK